MALHTLYSLTPNHIPELVQMEYELFPENNFNEHTLRHQIMTGFGWILFVDGKPAGYSFCSEDDRFIDILRLGVLPPYWMHGLGTVLLKQALSLGKSNGKDVMLTVQKTNVPAMRLYRKHGFEITGTMPQHDCWVMIRGTSSS